MRSAQAKFKVWNIGRDVTAEELSEALSTQLALEDVNLDMSSLKLSVDGRTQEAEFQLPDEEADLVRGPMSEAKVFIERISSTVVLKFSEIGKERKAPSAPSRSLMGGPFSTQPIEKAQKGPSTVPRSAEPEPLEPSRRIGQSALEHQKKVSVMRQMFNEDPPSPRAVSKFEDPDERKERGSIGPEMANCSRFLATTDGVPKESRACVNPCVLQ
mmetsp:Transcript_59706/g.129326  ORF Transcript_59706/g.129326 Transcript_59706/m.129326 type:complete len:214 (+) Transcript_59706:15-656(+)